MESTDKHLSFAPAKGCRQWSLGCLLIVLLFVGLLCGLLTFLLKPRSVSAAGEEPLAVWLLIDNSNSMYEKDGVGSDPDLLRLDAARLFLSYLGVDEQDLVHQAGVIFFGTGAETVVPLTPLTDDENRAALFSQISDPPRMGWTDHLVALQLAQAQIEAVGGKNRTAIILLTDGKPEWPNTITQEQQADYLIALQAQSAQFVADQIPLFIILLSNQTTDQDEAISNIWRPLWAEMSRAAPPGRFYVARTAGDLPDIYHDIVLALTGEESAGVVMDMQVPDGGVEATLNVPTDLAQLTLVISKSDPAQQVYVETEDGRPVTAVSPSVRRAGGSVHSLTGGSEHAEEVWVIEEPPAGDWRVRITGPGEITIWQDYKPQRPTPTPTSVPPMPTPSAIIRPQPLTAATGQPASQPSPSPTATRGAAVIVFITPPAPTALATTTPPQQDTQTRWVWGGLFLIVAVVVGGIWRRQARRPHVSGTLRVLVDGRVTRTVDLDGLAKTAVSLGKAPADLPLPGATVTATIVPGARLEDVWHMFIRSDGRIRLDGKTALPSAPLTDAALIDLGGGVQVRYENLRLRRADRMSAHHLSQKERRGIRIEKREIGH